MYFGVYTDRFRGWDRAKFKLAVSLISETPRIAPNRRMATNRRESRYLHNIQSFSCVRYIKDGTCVRSTKFQIDISIVRAISRYELTMFSQWFHTPVPPF